MEWTNREVAELRRLWPTEFTTTQIGARLRRTEKSVQYQAAHLGLPSKPVRQSHRWHSEERIAQARVLWDQGVTTADIAQRMGVTKNSIVGLAHRNGFTPRPSPIKARDPSAPPRRAHIKRAPATTLAPLVIEPRRTSGTIKRTLDVAPPVPVVARLPTRGGCAYPMWPNGPVPRPAPFCTAVTLPGRPYCRLHHDVCHVRQPATPETPARRAA